MEYEALLDATSTLTALRNRCRAFCDARDWQQFHTPKDLAIGLSVEAAEVLERFRFKPDADVAADLETGKGREALADEMGDVLYFLLMLSHNTGIDLAAALESKLLKNEQKYPVDLSRGKNVKYTELDGVGTDEPGVDARTKRTINLES